MQTLYFTGSTQAKRAKVKPLIMMADLYIPCLLTVDYVDDTYIAICGRLLYCNITPIALITISLIIGESLFLREFVLGIQAQANSKNFTRPFMPAAPR
ncbi:hypothetical protein BOW53_16780, partial [Solemya pervernicosa gill symbiont]